MTGVPTNLEGIEAPDWVTAEIFNAYLQYRKHCTDAFHYMQNASDLGEAARLLHAWTSNTFNERFDQALSSRYYCAKEGLSDGLSVGGKQTFSNVFGYVMLTVLRQVDWAWLVNHLQYAVWPFTKPGGSPQTSPEYDDA